MAYPISMPLPQLLLIDVGEFCLVTNPARTEVYSEYYTKSFVISVYIFCAGLGILAALFHRKPLHALMYEIVEQYRQQNCILHFIKFSLENTKQLATDAS